VLFSYRHNSCTGNSTQLVFFSPGALDKFIGPPTR
jgi:hypothetical protein